MAGWSGPLTALANLLLWGGVALVLTLLIRRWRLGVWDIEAEDPPSPPGSYYVALLLSLILTGAGVTLLLLDR